MPVRPVGARIRPWPATCPAGHVSSSSCCHPGSGARDLEDPVLGRQTADEVRRSALLQVVNMGAIVTSADRATHGAPTITEAA